MSSNRLTVLAVLASCCAIPFEASACSASSYPTGGYGGRTVPYPTSGSGDSATYDGTLAQKRFTVYAVQKGNHLVEGRLTFAPKAVTCTGLTGTNLVIPCTITRIETKPNNFSVSGSLAVPGGMMVLSAEAMITAQAGGLAKTIFGTLEFRPTNPKQALTVTSFGSDKPVLAAR